MEQVRKKPPQVVCPRFEECRAILEYSLEVRTSFNWMFVALRRAVRQFECRGRSPAL